MAAPFKVYRYCGCWWLQARHHPTYRWSFDTQGEAIDYAYKTWPWWP